MYPIRSCIHRLEYLLPMNTVVGGKKSLHKNIYSTIVLIRIFIKQIKFQIPLKLYILTTKYLLLFVGFDA